MATTPRTGRSIRARLFDASAAFRPKINRLTYKTAGDVKLELFVFNPADRKPGEKRPAILLFHGGGWRNGGPYAVAPQCRYFAERGMVAYQGRSHAFFNLGNSKEDFASTLADCDKFFVSLGWLQPVGKSADSQ